MLASRFFLDDFMTNTCLLFNVEKLNELSPECVSWEKLSSSSKKMYFKLIDIEMKMSDENNLLVNESIKNQNYESLGILNQIEVRRLELVDQFV